MNRRTGGGSRAWARRLVAGLAIGAVSAALAQPGPPEAGLDPQPNAETITFQEFTRPIRLDALVDWMASTLDINFVLEDPGLGGATVEFRAPMEIDREDLLPMFESILSMYGYAITQTNEGVYIVTQGAKLPVQFEGKLPSTRIFATPLIQPSALQTAINSALSQDQSASARIAAIDDLGVLISTAPGPVNRTIESIIQSLLESREGWSFHQISLTYIAAGQARRRLMEFEGQLSARGGGEGGQQGGAARVSGTLINIGDRLILDHVSNALIFRGTAREAEKVRGLVDMIDEPSKLIVRRYTAGPMATQIAQMGARLGLGAVQGGGAAGGQRPDQAALLGSGFELAGQEASFFTYYGTPEQHELVDALVEEFADQARLEAMVVEFYKLEHADAEDATELLRELLELESVDDFADSPFLPPSLEQRGITRTRELTGQPTPDVVVAETGEDAGQALTPVEGVQILADTGSNQLVVRAPVRQQEEIESIIRRIDRRRPQVYLEARIVTVNASESFRLSIDTAITDPTSDVPIFTNFGLINDPRDTTITPLQGLTAAVIDNDYVPIIINALETEGDGRVLSTPTILVNDNETGSLDSTTNEPFSQTTQTVGTPTQTSLGGTISAGTRLNVTPQISAGGFLNLEFEVELSSFLEQSNPDLPPPTRSDVISSVVTVPSGSTVVIGGLTFESENSSVNKVPILGDIPVLGALFQDQSERSSLRTLYVFITPRILRDESFRDLRLLSQGPLEKANVAPLVPPLEPAEIPLLKPNLPKVVTDAPVELETAEMEGE
jgi:type II secretory pathway component GspD/PulD (secretin)